MWTKWIPAKVNCFVWCVSLNRVLVKVNLLARGVVISLPGCPLCSIDDEDVGHLFFKCRVAQNKSSFSNIRTSMECLVDGIKVQAFTWITYRGKKITTIWDNWIIMFGVETILVFSICNCCPWVEASGPLA
ncbi:hypothetical protein E3N88_06691 [Mikania micrantha]|uniref:Reverse transcriptase zinc-binding domain-containing protein n=1 Tax=Mikania micrantha TaxID=192012 RepID=A0A5N6PRF5_9ASTR|nr:hypothetical protein E3N88_06691 [Mikania micrantha]